MSRFYWPRIAALYVLASIVLTWPLAAHLTTRLGAPEGPGDPYLNLWILGWGAQAWLTDPAGVLTGQAFNANIFHPAAGTLTYSDHLLLQSLAVAPIYAATRDIVLGYNLLLLASIAASGLAMHALVRGVTGSTPAAIVAGVAWACWPYRTAHLLHIQLQSLYFLPLALWALHRVAAARRSRDGWSLALYAALQAISSVYYGVMTAVAVGVSALALAWSTGQWRSRRLWSRLALAAAAGAVLVAPVAVPYLRVQQREGFGRNLFEAAAHAAGVPSYTQVPPTNLAYGTTGLLAPRDPAPGERDRRHVEHQIFPGLVIIGLALLGAWRGYRSDARAVVISAVALVAVGVALSLGPEGVRPVYAAAADWVFGFQAIRAPARFAVVAMAGLCVLAGVGVARGGLTRPAVAILTLLMAAEYVNAPLALVDAPPTTSAVGAWLADAEGPGAVAYLPLSIDRENTPFMVASLQHRRPIVNGYSGQRPSFYTTLVDALHDPASADARAALSELAVRFVVSPADIPGAGAVDSPYVERARLAGGVVYELVWTEASEAAIAPIAVAEPPDPGAVPFAAGERAVYEVEWVGGPLDVPAGTITLAVRAPEAGAVAGAAWVLEASADTAPWVSRFFEAHDVFTTTADARLKPLVHVRSLHEGRRVFERAFVYDEAAGRVRSGRTPGEAGAPGALALPLAPGARDAVTALWYLRTLAIEPGLAVTLPLNEAGRGLTLEVAVGDREVVQTVAGPVEAFRVSPRTVERVPRRRPVEATVWLSADGRRLPVAADVAAGFGRIRLKLVDYRP